MAEKKWWEKVNDFFQPITNAIKETKNRTPKTVTTPTAAVNTINNFLQPGRETNNIVKETTKNQPAGNALNYNNMASGNHSWGLPTYEWMGEGRVSYPGNSTLGFTPSPTGSDGGGGTSYGYSGGGGYSAYPGYVSPYEAQLQEVLNRMMNRQPFSYDYMSDPMYQQYAKSYGIQGDLARQDTLGDVASMTGGLPSSYAVTAAQQAQNSWNNALNDMSPQLQDAAYQRWMGNYEADANLANLLTSLDSMAYDRYNADRNYNLALQDANNQARQVEVTNSYSMPEGMSYEEILDWGANNMDGNMTSAQQDAFMDYIERLTRLEELRNGGSVLGL